MIGSLLVASLVSPWACATRGTDFSSDYSWIREANRPVNPKFCKFWGSRITWVIRPESRLGLMGFTT